MDAAFVSKLQYLLTVGYTAEVLKAFTEYCQIECFDSDGVLDDLESIRDSSIIEHIANAYHWKDKETTDFFLKLRQALDIDPKPSKQNAQQGQQKHVQHRMYVSADQIDYALSSSELAAYKKTYLNQCSRLLPLDQRKGDEALLRVLAIGRKNGICLLQNIADTFCRVRINSFVNKRHEIAEPQFTSNYHLLKRMNTRNQKQNARYLESALQSFHKRICPKLQFTSLLKINDQLADYFEYTAALIKFVHRVVNQRDALPPFQIDCWIIPVDVSTAMTYPDAYEDSDDDDEDDLDADEEDEKQRIDAMIGDIESRLQHEKLIYHTHTNPLKRVRFARHLDKKINDFWMDNRNQMNKNNNKNNIEHDRSGAHKTRINIIVDRRKPKHVQTKTWADTMYIFSPPNDCNSISDDHCPESYLNASKTVVLPGKGYNDGQRHESQFEFKEDCDDIDVGKPVGGYQFTLSFHVESANDIKAYIFYQGWIARFFPQDMINIWPMWFHKSKQNKEFVNNTKNWKSQINELQQLLCDDQFENWYKDSTKQNDLF